jgi:hypothetical protein
MVIETGASVINPGADCRQCAAPRSSNDPCTDVHTSPAIALKGRCVFSHVHDL